MTSFEILGLGILMGMFITIFIVGIALAHRKDDEDDRVYQGELDRHGIVDFHSGNDSGVDRGNPGCPQTDEEIVNALRLLRMALSNYEKGAIESAIDIIEGRRK